MIHVITTFEGAALARYLGHGFRVCRPSRFPYLDLERTSPQGSLVFLAVDLTSIEGLDPDGAQLLSSQIRTLSNRCRVVLIVTPPATVDGTAWRAPKTGILAELQGITDVTVLDGTSLGPLLLGKPAFHAQMHFLTSCSYSRDFLKLLGEWIGHLTTFHQGRQPKLLIVDLDGLLWDGVLSEVGWRNIGLDENDPQGRAYLEFQKELKKAKGTGYVLAICSRNHRDEVLAVLGNSENMILKQDDFVLISADWTSKAAQVDAICRKLRVLEECTVFLDDDPRERDLIIRTHPRVIVPDLPGSPFERPLFLKRALGIENPFTTTDDARRTDSYLNNDSRGRPMDIEGGLSYWLRSLQARVTLARISPDVSDRVIQLANKTNQFNICPTQRTKPEMLEWSRGPGRAIWTAHYEDRIGNDGLIGIIGLEMRDQAVFVKDFILSCRAFGRGIEDSMLRWIIDRAESARKSEVIFAFRETGRNGVGMEFLSRIGAKRSDGLARIADFGRLNIEPAIAVQTAGSHD